VTYRPREFWEERLREHFDLRGTGETGLSLAYNRACYALRRSQLERALRETGIDPAGRRVLDVGCGTGFFTEYFLARGADVTGLDLTTASVERLRARFPQARFVLADVSEAEPDGSYDIVNAFDVLYHITEQERWEAAVRHLAAAVAPGGHLLLTDLFAEAEAHAEHNVIRPIAAYQRLLGAAGLLLGRLYPTHVFLNRELGPMRFLNRLPALLLAADRALLALGVPLPGRTNRILVAHRPAAGAR
jgi:2-polyprenyl-3-methyl-5-hydroxy-6-metoxy-1,4-benzoquinol methylase